MKIVLFSFLFISLGASSANTQSFDRPVTTIQTNEEGVYQAAFMHWSTLHSLFGWPADFVVLGEVESIIQTQSPSYAIGDTWGGWLTVSEVVVCPDSLRDAAYKIKKVYSSGGFSGMAVGDTVLTFMIPYEGACAIPCWRGANSYIGHNFHQQKKYVSCDDYGFLNVIRSDHGWDFGSLSAEELRLWRCVDPEGLLDAFIQEKFISEEANQVQIGE